MKFYFFIFAFLTALLFSCKKEVIVPVHEEFEIMSTRGGEAKDPNANGDEFGGITDPDNESEEDKVKNKKRKAR